MPSVPKQSAVRAIVYARYSSDNQSEASIDDQVRVCRRYAELQGFTVVAEYEDAAVSGASILRPGYQSLLEDARKGAIDIVLAEALDRLSRDLADVATLYKHLSYLGIREEVLPSDAEEIEQELLCSLPASVSGSAHARGAFPAATTPSSPRSSINFRAVQRQDRPDKRRVFVEERLAARRDRTSRMRRKQARDAIDVIELDPAVYLPLAIRIINRNLDRGGGPHA